MTEVFEGVSVVDFTQGIIGSVATMIMSDYGADVIKVEPTGGDPHRVMPGSLQWNRGKRRIILDLNTRDGQKKARRLVENCDVVVENFTPGTAQQLGIDYETLSAIRPDIVYCSVTGWGPKGPYSRYKSYEGAVAAKMGRMMAFANQTKRTGPHYSAVQTATHATNMAAVRGITAAPFYPPSTRAHPFEAWGVIRPNCPFGISRTPRSSGRLSRSNTRSWAAHAPLGLRTWRLIPPGPSHPLLSRIGMGHE